jgi:hypothetical protein
MSEWLSDLVRRAILGRYKNGPWGYVPFPRRVPMFKGLVEPKGRSKGAQYGIQYERFERYRQTKKPLGWPFGKHSLRDLRLHLIETLGETIEATLLADQADAYAAILKNNVERAGQRTAEGAKAFLAIWRHIEYQSQARCPVCRGDSEEGLALKKVSE